VAIQEPGETAETTETPTPTEDQHCLPLVSGCGCAYVCARSLRRIDAERWAVVHDYQDSRVDEATIERWCFDETGVGSSADIVVANNAVANSANSADARTVRGMFFTLITLLLLDRVTAS